MAEEFEPVGQFTIEDLETLRITADPLRMQIFDHLLKAPATVRQVAERLGLAPSRLYYHFNLLEKAGLIRAVDTRMVNNIMEKFYRSVAYSLELADHLLSFESDENKMTMTSVIVSSLDATREELVRSLQARMTALEHGAEKKRRSVMIHRSAARLPDEKAEEFLARLQALMEEFEAESVSQEGEGGDVHEYALMAVFYPNFYYEEESQEKNP